MATDRVPRRGERVQVDGNRGTFIVVRVDKVNILANVELWHDPRVVLRGVPFNALHPIPTPVLTEAA
jgi:hypothetical protein